MDHQKVYNKIIENALNENRINHNGIQYEKHHIIPKCLEGNNKKENIVLLIPREHYICHKLLTYIYPNNTKILYAFYMMSLIKNKKEAYKISSKDYAYAKERCGLLLTTEEVKQKRKENAFNKKYSPEAIKKYLDSLKDTRYSPSASPIIQIPFLDTEEINKLNNEKLRNNIEILNKNGHYIGYKHE
jgi:hypothetical protein